MGKRSKIAVLLLVLCFLMGCNDVPALAVVPDVIETQTDVAVAVLTEQGLVPVVKEIADPAAPGGTALRTDPPAGSHVAIGGKVYLWVAAEAASTTPLSTTSVSQTSTTTTQTSTSATQPSTSSHPTTTTPSPTTTTGWCSAGHPFAEGTCSVCGTPDPNYVKTLSLGQTWTVENQWSFTILSVAAHNLCNPIQNDSEGYENQQVVLLRYTYENFGFTSQFDDLLIDNMSFTITQDNDKTATAYSCDHTQFAVPCAVGESCIAEEAYVLDKSCRRITLLVTLRTSNGRGTQRVKYDIPLA